MLKGILLAGLAILKAGAELAAVLIVGSAILQGVDWLGRKSGLRATVCSLRFGRRAPEVCPDSNGTGFETAPGSLPNEPLS